jgi:hypothetical protein
MSKLFTTRKLLEAIKADDFGGAKTFLRDRYFSNVVESETEKIDIDLVDSEGRKLAPFVNPKIGGKILDKSGYKTNSFEAPEVSPMRMTLAEEMLTRSAGESVYGSKSPAARAGEEAKKDLIYLDEVITRREEAMCAEALFSGRVTIKGDGYDEVIDFWKDLEEAKKPKTKSAKLWSGDVTAKDILAELRAIRRSMILNGGFTPTEAIMGTKALEAFLDKLEGDKLLDMRRVDMGAIKPEFLPDHVTYWGYLRDSGLDIYSYDEQYLNDENKDVPMVPSHLVLLGSPKVKTTMAYGCCTIADPKTQALQYFAQRRVPDSWINKTPAGRVLQIKSKPLPIINQVQGFHVLQPVEE